MIHRYIDNGKTTYRAYSLHDRGDGKGHCAYFVGAFDSSEAAKDHLQKALAEQVRSFDRELRFLRLALEHEGFDHASDDDANIAALRAKANALESDLYYLTEQAAVLFAGIASHHDGIIGLHGEAAVEYARRHGHQVRHTEYGADGNYAVDELVTPGRALELLPETQERRIFLNVPQDTITPDLPPSYGWYQMEREGRTPRTADDWRRLAADYRDMVKGMLERADEFERRAHDREVQP